MRPMGNIGQWLHSPGEAKAKTLVELVGQQRLVVEHHRGIACYGEEEIVVKASFGLVCISGKGMRLCCMSREQLCIRGKIDQVKLAGREGDGPLE